MSKALEAFKAATAAKAEIARVIEAKESLLDFSDSAYHALETLPNEVAQISGLEKLILTGTLINDLTLLQGLTKLNFLVLDNTQISDLSPLEGLAELNLLALFKTKISDLSSLQGLVDLEALWLGNSQISDLSPLLKLNKLETLNLDNTQVSDLRPIRDLPRLLEGSNSEHKYGLSFKNTPATRASPELALLSEIEDDETRTRDTLAFLKTLPPLSLPLPWEKPAKPAPKAPSRKDVTALRKEVAALQTDLAAKTDQLGTASGQIDGLTERLKAALERLKSFETETATRIDKATANYKASMDAAAEAFSEGLAIKEPVKLWQVKQTENETSRDRALNLFFTGLGIIGVIIILMIISIAKDPSLIDTLLAPIGCDPTKPETCNGFSYRALVVIAGILTLFTVILWFTRLQMKLYLAERHLVLDARERRAFAQTYIGFLREGDTSTDAQEQRALVYAALFRPSSDGTIKEDGGLDPAITAALSKWLSK